MRDPKTPVEQLAALPSPVQRELWRLVRAGAGLSQDERADVLVALVGVCEAFITHRPSAASEVAAVFEAVGQVLTEIDRAAFPRRQEATRWPYDANE